MAVDRSIPARAGEPASKTAYHTNHTVYPRACGGTSSFTIYIISALGLSPRVRGNQ